MFNNIYNNKYLRYTNSESADDENDNNISESENNRRNIDLIVNKFFTKIDKKEIKDRNISRPKGPITIILKNEENNNYSIPYKNRNINTNTNSNEIKSRNNQLTITNKENRILNNNINIISSNNNVDIAHKYSKTNNNLQ